jgi:hypothetical protein
MGSNKRISIGGSMTNKNCLLCKWETTIVNVQPNNHDMYYTTYVCDNPNCGLVQTFATPLKIGGIS